MNFSLYVIGNPNGYNQYPLDSNSAKFQTVLTSCESDSQLSVFRDNQLVQYAYVRRFSGENDLYLGFVLVVTGLYCLDCHALNSAFDNAVNDVLHRGKLIHFEKNNYNYQVTKFIDNLIEIKRIHFYFKSILENELSDLFVSIPSSFCTGHGQISMYLQDSTSNINSAVAFFDIVHIKNKQNSILKQEATRQHKTVVKRRLYWSILAVLLIFGVITSFYFVNQRKEKERIEMEEAQIKILRNTYDDAVYGFDRYCDNIVLDEKGREGAKEYVENAYKYLQSIEQCENDTLFNRLSENPCFENKNNLFQARLVEVRDNMYEKNKADLDHGVSNPYYDTIRARLKFINHILEQTNKTRMLKDVKKSSIALK